MEASKRILETGPHKHVQIPENEIFTGRNEVVAKVIFLHLSVILFTEGGGVCLSACWDTIPLPGSRHPPEQTPPPREQTPPRTRPPLGLSTPPSPPGLSTPNPPPGKQTPAYGQRAAGTHPTGMHSCLGYIHSADCLPIKFLLSLWLFQALQLIFPDIST